MMPKMPRIERRCFVRFAGAIGLAGGLCALPALAANDANPFALQGDFGGVGLLQTPTARMVDVGGLSFSYSRVEPYSRFSFSLQPFAWLEFGFRYTSVNNRPYLASGGERDFLDKGVDVKLRLLEEGPYLPAIALGIRDLGGTGLFSSEFLVASKRWYNFDFSIGVATGYIGAGGDIENPLGVFSDHFDARQRDAGSDSGGEFALQQWFTGDVGLLGGVAWRTPWDPLTLVLEYDGNDYQSEPQNNNQPQDSPFNFGARYRIGEHLVLSAGWERGNTAMFGLTLGVNLAEIAQPKNDPAPASLDPEPPDQMPDSIYPVAVELAHGAGIYPTRILRKDDTLIVEGTPTRYRSLAETELRAIRILHNNLPSEIKQFKFRWEQLGLTLREDTLPRQPLPREPFVSTPQSPFVAQDYRQGISVHDLSPQQAKRIGGEVLYDDGWGGYGYRISPDLQQNYGGPDGYLWTILLSLQGFVWTDDHGLLSGTLGYDLAGNLEGADYLGPSELPRVRTFVVEYLKQAELALYNLQYTRTARLGEDWFAMAYAGLLEMMYAGAGGEVLYRPFNSPLAVGLDVNWVRQRDFDVLFDFRNYETVTGHLSAYWETGIKDILAIVRVGRYLARDWGVTLNLSRRFDSGVRFGAWATFTDAGDAYGEGSFDKGIYISVPWDAFFDESTRTYSTIAWDPLTRDGGAPLHRETTLYGLTHGRDLGRYWRDFEGD